jgi:hypothetical protein
MRNSQIPALVLLASIMILVATVYLRGQSVASPDDSKSALPITASSPVKENPASSEPGEATAPGPAELA